MVFNDAMLRLLLLLLLAPIASPQEREAPSRRELEKLIPDLVEIDWTARDARRRLDELLEPTVGAPLPSERDLEKLRKAILKARAKHYELPSKTGEYQVDPVTGAEVDGGGGRLFIEGKTRKPKGLLIGLHGGGVGSGDAGSSRNSYAGLLRSRGWVGLFPEVLEKTEHGWTDSGTEEWLARLVDQALAEYEVPPDRVYMTGHSMGGYGTWVVGARHADLFAGLAATAGAPTPVSGPSGDIIDVQRGVVPNLRNIPMVVFQSTDDPRVPPAANQAAVAAVERAKQRFGGYERFDYWEVSDRGHAFPAEGIEAVIERIEVYERDPRPKKIAWQPVIAWKRQFHWLDWKEPRLRATVTAEVFPDERRIAVAVDGGSATGLAVLLSEELLPLEGDVLIELNGNVAFEGPIEPTLDAWVRTALWGDPGREYVARIEIGG